MEQSTDKWTESEVYALYTEGHRKVILLHQPLASLRNLNIHFGCTNTARQKKSPSSYVVLRGALQWAITLTEAARP